MKLNDLLHSLIFTLFFILFSLRAESQSLSGAISDSASHKPIPGAVVYVPQLKLGATTDTKGIYKIISLPNGTYEVQVTMLGYGTITKQITIKGDVALNFVMGVSTRSSNCVVITALGNATNTTRSPVPVELVTHQALLETSASNAVDAIANTPGFAEISEGPGIGKPEINGLGYTRVLTLFDGEPQSDNQWGDEHTLLVNPYAVYDVEVFRGPSSMEYGMSSIGGVLSFKSQSPPDSGTIQGSVLSEYQTNDGLIGNSVDVTGNNKGFVWDLRESQQEAHCYWDPKDGYVWSTEENEDNVRGVIGLEKKWGYSRLSVSVLHTEYGVPDGFRDSATGRFEFDTPQPNAYGGLPQYYTKANAPNAGLVGMLIPGTGQIYPTRTDFLSYNTDIAQMRDLDHDEAWWQNNINAGRGTIVADVGFVQTIHHEIDSGNFVAAENMVMNEIPYSFKYKIAGDSNGLKFTTGLNGSFESSTNGPEPSAPYIVDYEIPNYTCFDIGGFAILTKDFKNLTLSAGLRYDSRTIVGQPEYLAYYNTPEQILVPQGTQGVGPIFAQHPAFNDNFNGLSASLGATYQLPDNNYVKINVSKSFRPPEIIELSSNEVENLYYRIGNPNLKAEQGYEEDVAYGNNGRDVNFEVDGFCNYINNFIFTNHISSKLGGDSIEQGAPVFKYEADNAIIAGATASVNIHPTDTKWIEVDNGFTYIYSYFLNQGNSDSTLHVPYTQAPRLTSEVKFKLPDRHHSILEGTYFEVGLAKYWAQNDIYSANYTELPSLPYTLFNAGMGTNFVNRKTGKVICSFYVNCTNLTNIAYVDHMSHEQYFWAYNGAYAGGANYGNLGPAIATVTRQSEGIYNMGRNIGFKLLFPIGGHKVSTTESGMGDND